MQRSPEQTPWFGASPVCGEVQVGGRGYRVYEPHPVSANQGLRLWPASVLLARELVTLDLKKLRVCEVGAGGHGLPGMAVSQRNTVTFVEKDPVVAERLEVTLRRNRAEGEVVCADWQTAPGEYDAVVGSEVIYGGMGLAGLAAFLKRAWNGKGPCLLVNGSRHFVDEWCRWLKSAGLSCESRALSGTHLDGRPFAVDLWEVRHGD